MSDKAPHDGTVQTLATERGDKYNEQTGEGAIAFISRSIVFLPRGAKPEKRVRVSLSAIIDFDTKKEKLDRAQRPMYRAKPAPVQYEDRWRDNGNGTISRVTYSINWLLEETEEGVCETRPIATKEEPGERTPQYRPEWGADIATSKVVKIRTPTTIRFRERVVDMEKEYNAPGGIVPRMERYEEIDGTPYTEKEWVVRSLDMLSSGVQYLEVTYSPELSIRLNFWTTESMDSGREQLDVYEQWEKLPQWVQQYITTEYFPLCSCTRQRIDQRNLGDKYPKCELCRAEESCERCARMPQGQPLGVKLIEGKLICTTCKPLISLEKFVEEKVAAERRAEVVTMVEKLLLGKPAERAVGEIVLGSTLGHITTNHRRTQLLEQSSGYAWYYCCEDGMYGSKFSPTSLQLLKYYSSARENGLVTLTAWLLGRNHKTQECERSSDFFWKTQVEGENREPSFSEYQLAEPLIVAVKLRGSEDDRQKATEGYERLAQKLGEDAPESRSVKAILEGDEQNYAVALEKIAEAEEAVRQKEEQERQRAETEARLPELLREHYPTCPLCEEPVAWEKIELERVLDRSTGAHFCDCLNQNPDLRIVCQALDLGWGEVEVGVEKRGTAKVIRHTKAGDKVVAEVLVYHKYGRYNQNIRVYSEVFGAGEWKSGAVWQKPSDTELQIFKLEGLRERYPEQVASAEIEIQEGQAIKLQFRWEDRDNKKQLVAGNRKSGVLYVVDRKLESTTVPGKWYYCSLDRTLVDTETFKLYLVRPYLQANLNVEAEIAKLQAELKGTSSTSTPPQPAQTAVDLKGVNLKDLFGGRARKR